VADKGGVNRQRAWRAHELGERKEITTSHGRIAYHEAWKGPPLVLVHGFLANANIWRKLIRLIQGGSAASRSTGRLDPTICRFARMRISPLQASPA
jgi:pimeloyl-ACP methyl ester carboxylesterase